jgi:HSP20 family molecular chaperone IbpA
MVNRGILKVACVIVSLLLSPVTLAQKDHDQIIQDFLKQRKKMMEEIMKAFDEDKFFKDFDDDFFNDDIFEKMRKHGLGSMPGFRGGSQNVNVQEIIEEDGTISIIIKPTNENMKLDVQTTESQIIINAETLMEEKNEGQQGNTSSFFKSSFSRTIAIPQGYVAQAPTVVEGGMKIRLVPRDKNFLKKKSIKGKKKGGDMKPVGKQPGEETI